MPTPAPPSVPVHHTPAGARLPARSPDEEFASALLVRLTQQELVRQGVFDDACVAGRDPRRGPGFGPTVGEARVALAPKRALLAAVAERAGYRPLLEVGRGLGRLVAERPDDPVLAALVRATDPRDAFARWQRLERFLHSRHRVEVEDPAGPGAAHAGRRAPAGGAGALVVRHVGPPGEPPTPAEDALILGVLAALCRAVGAADLTVTLCGADGTEFPVLTPAGVREPPASWSQAAALATWRFAWSGRGIQVRGGDVAAAVDGEARPLASRLAAVVAGDLGRTWTLATAARALDRAGGPSLAPRTLQRRLAAEQATFPGVVRSARVAAAGRLLAEGALAVGVVGFVCGFSDQPHFTRQFRRQTGLTPAAYRRAFSARAR